MNYNPGRDVLDEADALNIKFDEYIQECENNNVSKEKEVLEDYKTNILGYLVEIGAMPVVNRIDHLTKDDILAKLNTRLRAIDMLLKSGGGKRKRKRSRKSRRSRRKSRRSRRSRRKSRKSKRSSRRRHKSKRSH